MKKCMLFALVAVLLLSAGCKATESTKVATEAPHPETNAATEPSRPETETIAATEPAGTDQTQKTDRVLPAWTGAFTEENLRTAIESYAETYIPYAPSDGGPVTTVTFDTEYSFVSGSVSRLSKVNDENIETELTGYIDTSPTVTVTGNSVTVHTGFWYTSSSWVSEWPVWSYLVRLIDAEGAEHYYYFRVEYSNTPVLQTAADFETYIRGNQWLIRALGCTFEKPEDISAKFYFYRGVDANAQATGDELDFILNAFKQKNPNSDPEFAHNYIRLPVDTMNEALAVLGVTVADLKIPESWVYNAQTDAYYFWASDAYGVGRWKVTEIVKGVDGRVVVYWQTEDGLMNTATGEHYPSGTKNMAMLLQKQNDGTYRVLSNQPRT